MTSLTARYTQYTTLLSRIGRCLCFGCTPEQTRTAAAIASRLTRAWPHAFVEAEGYVRLPLDELRSEQNAERVSVEGGKGKTVNEREVVDASRRAAELARGRLLDVLFGVGKGRESGPVGFVVDERVVPLKDAKIPSRDSFTAFSRFGTGPSSGPTILNRIPTSWKPNGAGDSVVIQSAVFSEASMRPVATVESLLKLRNGQGQDLDDWVRGNSEVLSRLLRELEDGERRGRTEVEDVERAVDALERETWNREDAVEDMGSAKS
ncbi:hypothetical protein SAPIO_CDS0403 [Scedosporium apiospermum]|uniref:Uncharacterized protein n=1 Tax=Pseudallescheria apiosperma TaxID=563466 RepID=A0A084GGY0_PSEDA|nr:uncharacterized protein SAPIO_CDS0403 [Scedosporium apiospermum]KEZ46592.1 hypothetical protein SAPIO_CDS0403 [Scedosporium apiospermum]